VSKTISITIPDQLETKLQLSADKAGISRSRYIGNLLLQWGEHQREYKECKHKNSEGNCIVYNDFCDTKKMESCRMFSRKQC
jgi:hypothetical protein